MAGTTGKPWPGENRDLGSCMERGTEGIIVEYYDGLFNSKPIPNPLSHIPKGDLRSEMKVHSLTSCNCVGLSLTYYLFISFPMLPL